MLPDMLFSDSFYRRMLPKMYYFKYICDREVCAVHCKAKNSPEKNGFFLDLPLFLHYITYKNI